MRTVDRLHMRAPVERVFRASIDVEQWPVLLSHYRWVRMLERRENGGLVEMAAWRPFGWFRYPTWWVSEMWVDRGAVAVHYRHVRGITTGMDVVWEFEPSADGTDVRIVHHWAGPAWPLVGPAAAAWVIGPVFIHGIASRTLAGIARHVEGGDEGTKERGNGGTWEWETDGPLRPTRVPPFRRGEVGGGGVPPFPRSIVPPFPSRTDL